MQETDDPLEADVRAFLEEHWRRGNRYVKVGRIAKAVDANPRAVTPVVRRLVNHGPLEVWNKTDANAATYRIVETPRPASGGGGVADA